MFLPIQAAPVQREYRKQAVANQSSEGGITPSGICDDLCSALPFPANIACKAICPIIIPRLGLGLSA